MKKFYFTIKLLKRGFVANAKWRKEPGFGMLHHKLQITSKQVKVSDLITLVVYFWLSS